MRFLSFSLAPHALYWLAPAALLLAALSVWAYRAIAPSLPARTRSTLTWLRAAALVGMAFLLARPLLSLASDITGRGTVVVLVDRSRSMELPADSVGGEHARPRADVARASAVRVVKSLAGHYHVVERAFAGGVFAPAVPDSVLGAARERTAIGDALTSAVEGVEGARGVVVVTDGASTAGRDPVTSAREFGLPVATVAVGETPGADVAVLDVLANPTARVGQETPVDVRVRALGPPRRTRLTLTDDARERFEPARRGSGGAASAGAPAGASVVPTSAAGLRPYAMCVLVGLEPGQLSPA